MYTGGCTIQPTTTEHVSLVYYVYEYYEEMMTLSNVQVDPRKQNYTDDEVEDIQ